VAANASAATNSASAPVFTADLVRLNRFAFICSSPFVV
jgi:hypothetical protein